MYQESSPRHSPGFASGIAVCISPLLVHVKEKNLTQSAHKLTQIHYFARPEDLKISATTWTAGWYHFIYFLLQVYHISIILNPESARNWIFCRNSQILDRPDEASQFLSATSSSLRGDRSSCHRGFDSRSHFNCIALRLTYSAGVGLDVARQPLHGSSHLLLQGQNIILFFTSFQGHRLKVCGLMEQMVDTLSKSWRIPQSIWLTTLLRWLKHMLTGCKLI